MTGMDVSLLVSESGKALRIRCAATDTRTPTHFILLLDTSDSMMLENKLGNLQFCTNLALKLMTPADTISLVTFGNASRILLSAVPTDAAHLNAIDAAIANLKTDGCTNLSAGLASVQEILQMSGTQKPLLLLLTDGYANRGVMEAAGLNRIMGTIYEQFPNLGVSVIAYGTDHNAALLKDFAQLTNGSYSIVGNLEDAALTMGYALGGALSCVAQNVELVCAGATVEGPYRCTDGRITIGDLHEGVESLILLNTDGVVTVRGSFVPSLEAFSVEATPVTMGRSIDIELTRLRYTCSGLFKEMRQWGSMEPLARDSLVARVGAFRAGLNDPFLEGHAITGMLKGEGVSLDQALEIVMHSPHTDIDSQIQQHEAFTSLGRGTTRPIYSTEDPSATVLSPMTSRRQQQMASLMRNASQEGV
jgi:Mg-chelatase subunit ChlD